MTNNEFPEKQVKEKFSPKTKGRKLRGLAIPGDAPHGKPVQGQRFTVFLRNMTQSPHAVTHVHVLPRGQQGWGRRAGPPASPRVTDLVLGQHQNTRFVTQLP